MFSLKGKSALVTGAATGLGQGIAVGLAQQGCQVSLSDKVGVSLQETADLVKSAGGETQCFEMDVRDTETLEHCVDSVAIHWGRLDILVNNAGVNLPVCGDDVTEAIWDEHFNTNVKGGFFVAQHAARHMKKQGWGRIIFISSQSGVVGIPGQPVYCSTKGAVIQLVKALGLEWAKSGITVNSVAPTFIETNLTRERLKNRDFKAYVLGKIPTGKLGEAKDVTAAVCYLASDEARMVNCTTHCVDGGWTAW